MKLVIARSKPSQQLILKQVVLYKHEKTILTTTN